MSRVTLFALTSLCLLQSVSAQAQEASPEVFAQLTRVIRWSGVLTSIVVVFGVWFGLRIVGDFFEKLSTQFPARRLLLRKITTILQFVVYITTASVVVILSFHIDQTVLTLLGGTLAVSIGFAIRDVVASFIAGIIIVVDRPFQVGDRVTFGGEYGDITAIGLRSVRLQTLDDNTVTIPNNKFINDMTSCGNYGALDMQVVMDFFVGSDQDIEAAREIVTEAALTSRYIHLPKPVAVLINQVIQDNYVAVRLRLKAYVLDTKYEKNFETDVNLRVMKTFRANEIHPPAVLHRNAKAS